MQVYSVIVDTDNFNSGLMGVFHSFTKALDALIDLAKKQSNRCQGIGIAISDLDHAVPEYNKSVYFCFNYYDRRVISDKIVVDFKILIRYPEDNQDIFKILTEYKFPFDTTFKPWD